jgi:hypothetical protein
MSLDDDASAGKLKVELLDASGRERSYGELPAPPAHKPLEVVLPVAVDPGRYVLLVREAAGNKEVARNSFQVVPRQPKEIPDR